MIVFISPGASGKRPIGLVGFWMNEDEARDVLAVMEHSLSCGDQPGIKVWFTYADVAGEEDPPHPGETESRPSPLPELEG